MTPTAVLAHQLDLAFNKRSWHGPNLLGSLHGVTSEEAFWRPQPDRHNINELVLHTAYWKYRVCRLITDKDVPAFELDGSDFFERPVEPTRAEFAAAHDLYHAGQIRLLRRMFEAV